ncbi:hypothetical protein Tco_1556990, partial [Tanacetum coccineum]
KIYSNPLFEFDDEYIYSDINPLFDKVLEDIECKDSYDSNLDESTFLVTPLSDSSKDECFIPSDDVELLLHHDSSTPMISVVSILEKKILYDDPVDDLIFDPGGDIDEIDAFLDIDIPMNIKDGFYDSEGDVLYLESLLSDDTTPSPPPQDCPNYEDSRARGFVHRSLDLQSLACLYWESDILDLIDSRLFISILNKRL